MDDLHGLQTDTDDLADEIENVLGISAVLVGVVGDAAAPVNGDLIAVDDPFQGGAVAQFVIFPPLRWSHIEPVDHRDLPFHLLTIHLQKGSARCEYSPIIHLHLHTQTKKRPARLRTGRNLLISQSLLIPHSTTTRSVPLRPKTSGEYISSALAGGTMKVPGVVARAV